MGLISDYLTKFIQMQYYDFLDSAVDESRPNESAGEKAKREDSLMLRNIFFYMFYILKAASMNGFRSLVSLIADVLLARIARLDLVPASVQLVNQLVAILNATATQSPDDTNSVICCEPEPSNASSVLSPAKTVFAPEPSQETPSSLPSAPSLPTKTDFAPAVAQDVPAKNDFASSLAQDVPAKTDFASSLAQDVPAKTDFAPAMAQDVPAKNDFAPAMAQDVPGSLASLGSFPAGAAYLRATSLGSTSSSVRYAEGYDVETYVSARHRQFLDLPRNDGIWVLTRASDSTLPVDVATMIYYLLNTVVQFLQQCVHHSERRGGGSPKAGASSRSWRPTGSAVCRSWCR